MELLVFDGNYDAYFWVLCVDKYCKVRGITEKEKMVLATTAMTGSALKWWCWWSPRHPGVSWNTFTIALLWRFKPEDRCILPLVDDNEEEPDQEPSPLMKLDDSCEELNDVLKAWDVFLLSTEEIEVPRIVNAGNLDPHVTTNEFIEKPKSLDDSLPIDGSLPPHHLVRFHGSDSLEDFHLNTKFNFPQFSQQFSSTFTPKTAISFNTALLRNDTLRDDLFGASFIGSSSTKMIVMLPLNFISLFDPGGTHFLSTLSSLSKPSDNIIVATSLLETPMLKLTLNPPPEKPPYGDYDTEDTTRITKLIQTCLSCARRNVPMQSLPAKPPDQSVQIIIVEFQAPGDLTNKICSHVFLSPPPPKPPDHSFQQGMVDLQFTQDHFLPQPLPEPPDAGNRMLKFLITTSVSGAYYMFVEISLRYSLNFVKDWGRDWTACSVSHRGIFLFTCESALLVDSLVTCFIEIGMLEEEILLFILSLQMHMRLHKAPFVIMLPVCASIDENVAYCCGRNDPCYCYYENYWIGPKIMQENRVLFDELLHAIRCITGTDDQIALLDLRSKIGDVGTTQQGWHNLLKMILDCSNSLFVGYIKIGFVMAMQVVYGNLYPMRLICGCSFVYCVVMLKKRDINSCYSSIVLGQYGLIHYCLWKAHHSSCFSEFNCEICLWWLHNQGGTINNYIMLTFSWMSLLNLILISYKKTSDHEELPLVAINDYVYMTFPTCSTRFMTKSVKSVTTLKFFKVLIISTWQDLLLFSLWSFSACEYYVDLHFIMKLFQYFNKENKSKIEGYNWHMTIIVAQLVKFNWVRKWMFQFQWYHLSYVAGPAIIECAENVKKFALLLTIFGYNANFTYIEEPYFIIALKKYVPEGFTIDFENVEDYPLDVVTLLNGCFVHKNGSSQFHQWDPGGCSFFHSKGLIDFEATWVDTTISEQRCLNFNLEDKVDFNGGSNVMIQNITWDMCHLIQ